jgi:hypothetical protein
MPFYAAQIREEERARRVELGSDQCILDGEHFFILGNLDIPIIEHDEQVRWSVWSTLSEKNFARAAQLWNEPGRESEVPYFGFLSTAIPGYPSTLSLQLQVRTQPVGVRPLLVLLEQDHPLYREQRDGITWERACELSRAAM